MKSYLELVAIWGKVHKKESRMTKICIFLSVFLIVGLFGMADMEIRSQKLQAIQKDGAWHAAFRGLSEEDGSLLMARPEVETASWYYAKNYGVNEGWTIDGVETVICGFDMPMEQLLLAAKVTEGSFPEGNAIACTKSLQERLGLSVGDVLTLTTPTKETLSFVVSGFLPTTSMLTDADAFGVVVNTDTFLTYFASSNEEGLLYVKFVPFCRIQKAIADISVQFGLSKEQVGQNAYLLGLMFQSKDTYLLKIYLIVGILALLVAIAGILMITGSLNSSVAQRTEFFGLMRCLGATKGQVAKFVRREALGWCKTAIPAAILAAMVMIWCLCAMLRYLSPHLFRGLPVFGVSVLSIVCGVGIGLLTVLLAARTPAKKASKVSPLVAVSGNAGTTYAVKRAADTKWIPMEVSLGIHHARGSQKNFLLMSGSFAFSILLFLSFGTLWDFMGHALTPLRASAPDISIISQENTCSIPKELAQTLSSHPAVKKVYGRSFAYDIDACLNGQNTSVTLVSYEKYQFAWAKKDLFSGSLEEAEDGRSVLAVYQEDNSIEAGDLINIERNGQVWELLVSGTLTGQLFDVEAGTQMLFCSESLFEELTGEDGYTIIDLQVYKNTTDSEASELRALVKEQVKFSDKRLRNMEVMGAYYAFLLFLYGFLAVVLMISAFHIMNSMAMSVSSRMGQYQSLYAIGMSSRQIFLMIVSEGFTYLFSGILFGVPTGLWLHQLFYQSLITSRWGDTWKMPFLPLFVILTVLFIATVASFIGPAKRIRFITCNPCYNEL